MSFEKVLWRTQPYADNHVPASFLSELRTNSDIARPSVWALVLASLRVSTALLRVAVFAIVYTHLLARRVDAELVLGAILVCGAVGAVVRRGREPALASVLGKMVVALVLLAVSPVLRTLTEATTSDTIWALAAMLFTAHLVLADYVGGSGKLQDTLSFNAAISASVVLASRLDDDVQSFSVLALAITLFAPQQHSPRDATRVAHFVAFYCAVLVGGRGRWRSRVRGIRRGRS
ncbi:hypothetical protein L1887_53958 [Cichorium endivia]|nr:hypothetical protein L1887_53958 [Cichorium endivia]